MTDNAKPAFAGTSEAPCSELPGYPRAETIRCPECDHVQAAHVHFADWMPFPSYVHDCEACGYTILETEWDRIPNAPDQRRAVR